MRFLNFFHNLVPWFLTHGVRVIVILVLAYLVMRIGRIFIARLIRALVKRGEGPDAEKIEKAREKTLTGVFYSTLRVAIWVIVVLTILPEFGINIGPLLAGVGVVGLALGMGARSIIQDHLVGLFIIIEDQYRVGEEVKIAGMQGRVMVLNLRRTILKDQEGVEHSIPNGKITIVSNFSRSK